MKLIFYRRDLKPNWQLELSCLSNFPACSMWFSKSDSHLDCVNNGQPSQVVQSIRVRLTNLHLWGSVPADVIDSLAVWVRVACQLVSTMSADVLNRLWSDVGWTGLSGLAFDAQRFKTAQGNVIAEGFMITVSLLGNRLGTYSTKRIHFNSTRTSYPATSSIAGYTLYPIFPSSSSDMTRHTSVKYKDLRLPLQRMPLTVHWPPMSCRECTCFKLTQYPHSCLSASWLPWPELAVTR